MHKKITATEFLRDVSRHTLTVGHHDGLYRHLRFRNPADSNLWFDLVTWPGVLTINGDMGTWAFARVEDMFTFFRRDKLEINESYWSEKLLQGNYFGSKGARVFNSDVFASRLLEQLTNHYGFEGDELAELQRAIKEEILIHDGEELLRQATYNFRHGDFYFDPCEIPDGKDYSYQFLWSLYAIVWGIQQWDKNNK